MSGERIYVGTSGWTYDDWQGLFYPERVKGASRLEFYAERFNTVEVNASFYRLPTEAMINAWNRRLGGDFQLVLKGSRFITHRKKLADCGEAIGEFFRRAGRLERLAVVLWQLPPSLHKDIPRLDAFLNRLPKRPRHAVEFRHASWWDDETAEVLSRRGASFVALSHPTLPANVTPTTDFLYLRFHGVGAQLYQHDYSDKELAAWADRVIPHLPGRRLYAFFNNDYQARAPKNAERFRELVQQRMTRNRQESGDASSPGNAR